MGGQFEVYRDKQGKYHWKLAHKSGLVLASSGKGHSTKMDAIVDLWSALNSVAKQ